MLLSYDVQLLLPMFLPELTHFTHFRDWLHGLPDQRLALWASFLSYPFFEIDTASTNPFSGHIYYLLNFGSSRFCPICTRFCPLLCPVLYKLSGFIFKSLLHGTYLPARENTLANRYREHQKNQGCTLLGFGHITYSVMPQSWEKHYLLTLLASWRRR